MDQTLGFLRTSSFRTPYRFVDRLRLLRLVAVDGRSVLVEFDFGAHRGHLVVRLPGETNDAPATAAVRRLVRFVWALDDDLSSCYRVLGRDPRLRAVVRRHAGLRMVRAPDAYEALITAVLGQQVSVSAAEAIRRRLLEGLGPRVRVDGHDYLVYPSPDRLLRAGAARLARLGASRQKARYLLEVAARARAGDLAPRVFARLSDDEATDALRAIPGVGRWTAEVVLMRGLGRRDVFPAADLGLAIAAQLVFGLRARPSEDRLRAMAERWRGWRSYAALYLWRTLGGGA